jgi:hypothetical protein
MATIAPPPRPWGEQRQLLTLPSRAPWQFDREMIERAIAELEITGDVHVSLSVGTRTFGTHRGGSHHSITLSKLLSADQAGETLWHELTHAAQSERLGDDTFERLYRMQNGGVGYRGNRFEREARSNQKRHYSEPLIRRAR